MDFQPLILNFSDIKLGILEPKNSSNFPFPRNPIFLVIFKSQTNYFFGKNAHFFLSKTISLSSSWFTFLANLFILTLNAISPLEAIPLSKNSAENISKKRIPRLKMATIKIFCAFIFKSRFEKLLKNFEKNY